MQQAADSAAAWSANTNMQLNGKKTKELVVDFSQADSGLPSVVIQGEVIDRVPVLHGKLLWLHITILHKTCKIAPKKLYLIAQLKRAKVPPEDILTIPLSPKLEYACPTWHTNLTKEDHDLIESVQKHCLKMLFPTMSYDKALVATNIPTLKERRHDICVLNYSRICNMYTIKLR